VLLPGKKLGPHHQHFFDVSEIADVGKINHIRVRLVKINQIRVRLDKINHIRVRLV